MKILSRNEKRLFEKRSSFIKIADLQVSSNKLVLKLDFSENISKFFLTDYFIAEYDKNIEDIDESILVIPIISTIIPIAWATGADIYVEKLDKTYLDSLNKVEQIFRGWYPQFSFSGKIYAEDLIINKFNNKESALLFSGGVDSLTSYLRHKDKQLTLISIWGADIPDYEYRFWNKVRSRLLNFADEEGLNIQFIKTNVRKILNERLLSKEYRVDGWWGSVGHGLILLGLCAPLTTEKIGTILIASSMYTHDFNIPWGSHPFIDNNASWADIKINNDGFGISRQEKIRYICKNPHYLSYLRVCYSQYREYNCGRCEKCMRTIVGLILENTDPKACNFYVEDNILNFVQTCLSKGMLDLGDPSDILMTTTWQEIQKHIPIDLDNTEVSKKYNSEEFFTWFKEFDLSKYRMNKLRHLFWTISYLIAEKEVRKTIKKLPSFIVRRLRFG